MFHYGKKPINNIKKDFSNIKLFEKIITNYPEPIADLPIKIDAFLYQDDFEISLLRFNHIIFGNKNKINLEKLKNLIGDSYLVNDLYLYFSKNINIKNYGYFVVLMNILKNFWKIFISLLGVSPIFPIFSGKISVEVLTPLFGIPK
jgi:hypothetical protein